MPAASGAAQRRCCGKGQWWRGAERHHANGGPASLWGGRWRHAALQVSGVTVTIHIVFVVEVVWGLWGSRFTLAHVHERRIQIVARSALVLSAHQGG